jgi:hypothetical protein
MYNNNIIIDPLFRIVEYNSKLVGPIQHHIDYKNNVIYIETSSQHKNELIQILVDYQYKNKVHIPKHIKFNKQQLEFIHYAETLTYGKLLD